MPSKKSIEKIETLVGAGSTVHGDIVSKNSLLINGLVTGNVETDHTIRVGTTGAIKGNVKAETAVVGGIIEGDLEAVVSTVLGPNSRLLGDLRTSRLTIKEGATFEGRCVMLREEPDEPTEPEPEKQEESSNASALRIT